jgi:formamidopyrimidine-DNA glycosylase
MKGGRMPELPEVETVCQGLAPVLVGEVIARVVQRRADLRIPFPENFGGRLEGRRVTAIRRRAKYILAELDNGETLVIHLGMSGGINIAAAGGRKAFGKHDHVIFYTGSGAEITYRDPRRFGLMTLVGAGGLERHPLFRDMGPEPLGNAFNGLALAAAFEGKKTPLKSALLDQKVVVGLGNIYVCEALYRARLSPRRQALTVKGQRAERLVAVIRDVLTEAIAAGGSTLRDYARVDGELGYFQHAFQVYGREGEPCQTEGCGSVIKRLSQSGRSTFYCPSCQR